MSPVSCAYVFAPDADQAEQKIAAAVIEHSWDWRGSPSAMTDADYDAMVARAAAEDAEDAA